jgi:hypothetical protein
LSNRRSKLGSMIIQKIILLAVIMLICGVPIFIIFFQSPWQFVGETLISGGTFAVLVYLILEEHTNFIMREKHLGLDKGQTLFEALNSRGINSSKYFYKQRDYEWEFFGGNAENWEGKVKDTITLGVNQEISHLTFRREADIKTQDTLEACEIKDLTMHEIVAHVQPEIIPDLSIPNKKYFRLVFKFLADHEYQISLNYQYPPSMSKVFDYIHMLNPVLTHRSKISLKIPADFDPEKYTIDCYVINSRYEQVKTLEKEKFDNKNRKISFKEAGPFLEGETIILRYRRTA